MGLSNKLNFNIIIMNDLVFQQYFSFAMAHLILLVAFRYYSKLFVCSSNCSVSSDQCSRPISKTVFDHHFRHVFAAVGDVATEHI